MILKKKLRFNHFGNLFNYDYFWYFMFCSIIILLNINILGTLLLSTCSARIETDIPPLDLCMTCLWPLHELSLTSAWPTCDLSMTCLWPQHDLPMTSVLSGNYIEMNQLSVEMIFLKLFQQSNSLSERNL